MKSGNKKIWLTIVIVICIVTIISISYAFINIRLVGEKKQIVQARELSLELEEDNNNLTIENVLPMYDEVGMIQNPFTFRVINNSSVPLNYIVRLIDITTGEKLDTSIVKYGLTKDGIDIIDFLSNLEDGQVDDGIISSKQTIHYVLRLWIDSSLEDNTLINNKSLSYRIEIEGNQRVESKCTPVKNIVDNSGASQPVLGEDMLPIIYDECEMVWKVADTNDIWYNYETQNWANAVILSNKSISYNIGEVVPEENIESYFVWIPRYKYKIFNEGNYNGIAALNPNAPQTIEIQFEDKTVTPSNGTTVGLWLTHPAFTAFETNGIWVGKFESGYKGATTTTEAEVNSSDSTELQIKPNVYSWRNINVGNAFKVSYDYARNLESHMMKNTEWGAVAYLSHSKYGKQDETEKIQKCSSIIIVHT